MTYETDSLYALQNDDGDEASALNEDETEDEDLDELDDEDLKDEEGTDEE